MLWTLWCSQSAGAASRCCTGPVQVPSEACTAGWRPARHACVSCVGCGSCAHCALGALGLPDHSWNWAPQIRGQRGLLQLRRHAICAPARQEPLSSRSGSNASTPRPGAQGVSRRRHHTAGWQARFGVSLTPDRAHHVMSAHIQAHPGLQTSPRATMPGLMQRLCRSAAAQGFSFRVQGACLAGRAARMTRARRALPVRARPPPCPGSFLEAAGAAPPARCPAQPAPLSTGCAPARSTRDGSMSPTHSRRTGCA